MTVLGAITLTLPPVRPGVQRQKSLLNGGDDGEHDGFISGPGEVKSDGVATVGGTQPEFIRTHCPHLADEQCRRQEAAHLAERSDGVLCDTARQKDL